MHRLLLILILFFSSLAGTCWSQVYGNEWINYNQTYYRFEIVDAGVYRLDYNLLSNAGIPLSTFSPANIQIFGKEQEVPIHIVDGNDSSFDPGDYLIFYAENNDGWLDTTLYDHADSMASPGISLYNDTLNYFFTWNNSTSNLRFQVETDVNFGAFTPANYISVTQHQNFTNEYHEGVKQSDVSSSFFVPGEGWGSGKINGVPGGHTANHSLLTPLPYTGAGAPTASFIGLSVSNSNAAYSGIGNHHMRWRMGSSSYQLIDTIFKGYKQIRCEANVPISVIGTGNTPLYFDIVDDQGALTDFQAFTYYEFTYAKQPNFSGANNAEFRIPNNPSETKIRLDIVNAGYANPITFVFGDIPRMIPFTPNGSVHSMLIPNNASGGLQKVVYRDESLITNITSLVPVTSTGQFTDYLANPGPFGIDSALLMVYHPDLKQASDNYRAYRLSPNGGGHNVIYADVNELYMQFGGGIEKHINGIRRFAHYIYKNATINPTGLFLMGKGIREANYSSFTSDGPGTRFDPARFHQSLIPSFGHPSSDVFITSSLDGPQAWTPLMGTGRISARTNEELQSYLDKVIQFETEQDPFDVYDTPNKDWQKQIIHFAGGSDQLEQNSFQFYMGQMEQKIEDSLYGGNVMRVYKTSSNPLDPTIISSVTDRIQEGVSIMSYFGHSSATSSGFEINLDDPANWNNSGRYPLMLVNSCYNGNIFQLSDSKSEEFVQVPNSGAIGYIASVAIGIAQFLDKYSQALYTQFSRNNYGATLGEQMKQTIVALEPANPAFSSLYLESTCSQMVLNGDPMLKINWHERPEIELLPENVYFTPEDLDLTIDSIEMHIILTNLGQSITDPFILEVVRDFPLSTSDSIYTFFIDELNYKDTFSFKMPMQANIGVGINNFTISADLPSQIPEQYDEITNNQITRSLFINIDGILPVIPYDFAVVPEDSVTVKASTINPIADWNTYRFEIDTTDLFNSPEHRYALVSGYGGVKEVHPSQWLSTSGGASPLTCEDSTVYFWRVAVEEPSPTWHEFSFQYIPNRVGWGQDHFFQFKKNTFNGVIYDRPTRTRIFGPDTKKLTAGAYSSLANWADNAWYIEGELQDYGIGTLTPKLHVGVVDPLTLTAWGTRLVATGENLNHDFGNNNDNDAWGLGRPMKYFTFDQNNATELSAFQNMITNEVPDGHYIVIYSPMTTRYDWWNSIDSTGMYGLFDALGSDSIHGALPNRPFAFFCQKGDTSTVVESIAQFDGGDALIEGDMIGFDYVGAESAPLIGPASNWGNVYWKQDPEEVATTDSTILTIYAYDIAGVLQQTIDTMFTLNDSIMNLNNMVDATQYPYISLRALYYDTTSFTPAQIDRWHVLFSPLPEAAIDGSTLYTWTLPSDTIQEGQTVQFAVDVKNIYTVDMDSLLISYWVEDANQVKHPIAYPRQDSLKVGDVLRDTITVSTVGFTGINSLWMEVNPYVNGSIYITDQPEQQHFNNLLQIPFFVNADDKNPILDVTFNGRHILNGDIIDPNSEVLITLKDDNEYLIMDNVSDTTLFGIYLTYPSGEQVRIPFMDVAGNTVMQWIPATSQNKRFKILWPTDLEQDGTYTLFVQGSDRSGNLSGDLEYRVSFEVIHASTITHMMNYPNPFSTSTRFVFTLTGSEAPDEILIQIMTVSGRVVREISEDELGPIQIGRNITEYAWDGTDEFGDPLANGVYLYRVRAQINGEDIEHRATGADQYFKKDFGKMYLLR